MTADEGEVRSVPANDAAAPGEVVEHVLRSGFALLLTGINDAELCSTLGREVHACLSRPALEDAQHARMQLAC
jgi:hypothetical protein